MSSSTSTRKGPRQIPLKDRRAAHGDKDAGGPLRKLKGLMARPLGLEQRDGHMRVVLTERRHAQPANVPPSMAQLCAELSARLLANEPEQADSLMRHLGLVHDALERRGWSGVAALPAPVLVKALTQIEALASEEASPLLAMVVEGLRRQIAAAEQREQRDSRLQDFDGESLEVSESDFAEFEQTQRGWVGTVPSGLGRPDRDDDV